MHFDLITLFPHVFDDFLGVGLWRKAIEKGVVSYRTIDLRRFGEGRTKRVDDTPYGGMAGMLFKAEPLHEARLEALRTSDKKPLTILFSPRGKPMNQSGLASLASLSGRSGRSFVLVASHYEGVDQRFVEAEVDLELSLGDYVIAGGELACLVFMEAMARQVPGFMGNDASLDDESFTGPFLEYDQYTKPRVALKRGVPSVLLSGNHGRIDEWKSRNAAINTYLRRPDLWSKIPYDEQPIEAIVEHIKARHKFSLPSKKSKTKV